MKTWFVTGTSTGLGREVTERLLLRGDRVAATLRRPEVLDDMRARFGELLWVARLDVRDADAVRDVVGRAFSELGRVDVVVNNAGYGLFGAAEEVSDAQIRDQIDTNLIGSIAVIRACLPPLRTQGGGRVLQISSEGGQLVYPNFSLYHASKWGIEGFVEAVSPEVAPFGITFTIVEPGPTRTSFRSGLVTAAAMAVYDRTPAGEVRRAVASGAFAIRGDAGEAAQAIIEAGDAPAARRRVVIGQEPRARVRAALQDRLLDLGT